MKSCELGNQDDDTPTTSFESQCTSDTTVSVTTYSDLTCSTRIETKEDSFDQCYKEYTQATETNYENYVYGECFDSSASSNDDEVTLSEQKYAGTIVGVLFAGMILGAVVGFAIIYFCCLKLFTAKATGSGGSGLNENLNANP